MKEPLIGGAITDIGHGYPFFVAIGKTHRRAQGDRQRLRQVADKADQVEAEITDPMHIGVTTTGDTGGTPKQVAHNPPRCQPT